MTTRLMRTRPAELFTLSDAIVELAAERRNSPEAQHNKAISEADYEERSYSLLYTRVRWTTKEE